MGHCTPKNKFIRIICNKGTLPVTFGFTDPHSHKMCLWLRIVKFMLWAVLLKLASPSEKKECLILPGCECSLGVSWAGKCSTGISSCKIFDFLRFLLFVSCITDSYIKYMEWCPNSPLSGKNKDSRTNSILGTASEAEQDFFCSALEVP